MQTVTPKGDHQLSQRYSGLYLNTDLEFLFVYP